jgi:glycosyltransferase involved in cell wall biosynthesis
MADDGLLLTVAICTRNRARFLEKAIRSVLAQITDDAELLVVDNGSTDGTKGVVESQLAANPCLTFMYENEVGVCAARNAALKKARGRYVLFLDDDATAEPGWLNAYRFFLVSPPSKRIGAVGGAVHPEYEVPPPKWINDHTGTLDLWPEPTRFAYRSGPWEGNCAYDRAAAIQVGMFDAQFGPKKGNLGFREGSDLNLRLQDAGYEIWWLPGAGIRHTIHAGRMNLRWMLNAAFNEGRSIAMQRLKEKKNRTQRLLFGLGRLVIFPFHCGINLLIALVLWPFQDEQSAANALLRAARIAGFAWRILARPE